MALFRTSFALAAALIVSGCAYLPKSNPCPETAEWQAWINAMPIAGPAADAGPSLIVTGRAMVPKDRRAILRAGPTDRMQPAGQRFTLFLFVAPGAKEGWKELRAEIRPSLSEYREVMISCAGKEIARIDTIETAH